MIPFGKAKVDWKRTVAWGEGGYYSRIFLNVKGREPEGVDDPSDYERVQGRDDGKGLKRSPMIRGSTSERKIFKPEEVYSGDEKDSA